jgi:TusA-related sulfurtransferase
MRIIDTRGQQCPAPLIATRRALKESRTGESFKVITNSQNAFENISRFLKDHETHFEAEVNEGFRTLIITKPAVSDQDNPQSKKGDHEG